MRNLFLIVPLMFVLLAASAASAKELVVRGDMNARMDFVYQRSVRIPDGVSKFECSFVAPKGFVSPTYSQDVEAFSLELTPKPDSRTSRVDERGNRIITAVWSDPPKSLDIAYMARTKAATRLDVLKTSAPFPLKETPRDGAAYLAPTKLVQSDDPDVVRTAKGLTQGCGTQYEACSRVANWVADHLRYVSQPKQFDALYSLKSGRGNCQNYSHLAAALLRAVGAPVRIVNGFTVKNPYSVRTKETIYTFQAGQGRHSWIEVWFPDLGWVPFDPQKTSLFVSNRFLRIEVGVDNEETKNDGRLRWWLKRSGAARPKLETATTAELPSDTVKLSGQPRDVEVRNIMLYPEVAAASPAPVAAKPEPTKPLPEPVQPAPTKPEPVHPTPVAPAPVTPSPAKPQPSPWEPAKPEPAKPAPPIETPTPEPAPLAPRAGQPVELGNLEFPENVDFADYGEPVKVGKGQFELTRNFVVETAEYVTTKARQYAQVVRADHPLVVTKVGLALHRFGGAGSLWVEIYRDEDGQPGELVAASDLVDLRLLSLRPGYRWADFSFRKEPARLDSGTYWIALGFTGEPVVNWYFTPGKPVGPSWGTRYKGIFEENWSGALDFEFNYRLVGVAR